MISTDYYEGENFQCKKSDVEGVPCISYYTSQDGDSLWSNGVIFSKDPKDKRLDPSSNSELKEALQQKDNDFRVFHTLNTELFLSSHKDELIELMSNLHLIPVGELYTYLEDHDDMICHEEKRILYAYIHSHLNEIRQWQNSK